MRLDMEQALKGRVDAELQGALAQVKVGDIILMRYHRGRIYRAIREETNSYWNHSALVFSVLEDEHGHRTILVIEAMPHGVEIHRLQKYLNEPDEYEIGIKRLPFLTDEHRERFMGYFLDVLDTPYDFTRVAAFMGRKLFRWFGGERAEDYVAKRVINVDQFICTSFAQRAFYLAVPPNLRQKTLFRESSDDLNFLYQMEYISPGDIARSRNTEWLYNPHD